MKIHIFINIIKTCFKQLTTRREQDEKARQRDEEEYKEEIRADNEYDDFLQQETERMRLRGFTPRVCSIVIFIRRDTSR